MGTSKSNSGPRDNMPLLPPWAPEPPDGDPKKESSNDGSENQNDQGDSSDNNKEKPEPKTAGFSNARRNLTRFIKKRNRQNFRSAAKSYVKSYGGGKSASKTAISGKSSGVRFSGFLSGIASQGVNKTLENYGLTDCIGKSAEYVLTKIADLVAPSGATNEEAAAREAIIDALSFLYDSFELNDKDIVELDSINKSTFEQVIKEYISSYIFNRWLHELGLKFEEKAASSRELIQTEHEAKEYIKEAVELDFSKIDLLKINFNSDVGKTTIDKIFDEAYILIETL